MIWVQRRYQLRARTVLILATQEPYRSVEIVLGSVSSSCFCFVSPSFGCHSSVQVAWILNIIAVIVAEFWGNHVQNVATAERGTIY